MSKRIKKGSHKRKKNKIKKIRLSDVENDACWKWAREMTKPKFPREWINKKVYCEVCNQSYCLGYDEVDQFCRDCFIQANKKKIEAIGGIFTGCQKENTGKRVCQSCSR